VLTTFRRILTFVLVVSPFLPLPARATPALAAQDAPPGVKAQAVSTAPTPVNPLFPTNPAPAYDGTKEFSLNIKSVRSQRIDGKELQADPQVNRTRVMEQLAGFIPGIVATDKWGGRLDHTEAATGFFYTKKIDGRWWAIDPAGHEYINIALVEVAPSSSPNGKAALARVYGDKQTWMKKTHAMLLYDGFNSAGAWSDVESLRASVFQASHPLSYTVILNFMAGYGKQRGGLHDTPGHAGFPNDTIFVFDPEFPKYVEEAAKQVRQYANDSNLFGYFSDNELPFSRKNLQGYLSLPHKEAGYIAARKWMDEHKGTASAEELDKQFLAYEADLYYSIVSSALRRNDPNHMYLGSRNTGEARNDEEMFRVLGKYADAISVNYYNSWTPDTQLLAMWERESGKPEIITEWYVKGADSGMPNTTGAGWLVSSQAERGEFYQNFVLGLIASKTVIGWQWFKYQDNDPNDPHAELSNKDANKGIVNTNFQTYAPLVERMRQLNPNAFALADYFDHRKPQ
jgi:hypothetical protein